MKRVVLAAVCGLALAAPANAAPSDPGPGHVVTEPDWLRRPTAEELARHYPELAQQLGFEGLATISCLVAASGQLETCAVVEEKPADIGFGKATLAAAADFLMRPKTVDGKPVAGGTVRIPLRWVLPTDGVTGEIPKPGPAGAMTQARRLVTAYRAVEQTRDGYAQLARKLQVLPVAGASDEASTAAGKALEAAAAARMTDVREAYAAVYANLFPEDVLAAAATFMESSAGAILSDPGMAAINEMLNRDFLIRAQGEARAEFCKARDCTAKAPPARPAAAAAKGPIEWPIWDQEASPEEIAAGAPPLTDLFGIAGKVVLDCVVTAAGGLEECRTEWESPKGLGLRSAAVALTGYYRLIPKLVAEGRQRNVLVHVDFPGADPSEPFNAGKVKSERGRVLARELVQQGMSAEQITGVVDAAFKQMTTQNFEGADAETAAQAAAAMKAGLSKALEASIAARADAYAARFTEAQLEAAIAYGKSPAAKALQEAEPRLAMERQLVAVRLNDLILADARAAYCKARSCEAVKTTPPPGHETGDKPAGSTRKP